jgi:hypothetical protein
MKLIVEIEVTNKNCVNCVHGDLKKSAYLGEGGYDEQSYLLMQTFRIIEDNLLETLKKYQCADTANESEIIINPLLKKLSVEK